MIPKIHQGAIMHHASRYRTLSCNINHKYQDGDLLRKKWCQSSKIRGSKPTAADSELSCSVLLAITEKKHAQWLEAVATYCLLCCFCFIFLFFLKLLSVYHASFMYAYAYFFLSLASLINAACEKSWPFAHIQLLNREVRLPVCGKELKKDLIRI